MTEKTPLVLAAGLLCDAILWQPIADLLSDIADVTIVDFIGLDSIGAMADKLLTIAPPRFALAGHSMGARVALEAWARGPERIERLALLDTGTHKLRQGEPEKRAVLTDLAFREGIAAAGKEWLPPMMGKQGLADQTLMARLEEMISHSTPETFARQIKALVERPDAEAALATVTVPTLLLSATEDQWSPPAQHEEMLTMVPHAKLVIVQNAGHMAPIEQPEAVAAAMREWLA
ncbi:alpha/beta fold hydrolase [Sphingomonas sp. MMS24-J13]|uniref:alpha/beta fold hydrolase n=1 Tax=Sphingomonas sp. MMS24-J13 TaxID=3238686 RepID=UPI00384AC2DE